MPLPPPGRLRVRLPARELRRSAAAEARKAEGPSRALIWRGAVTTQRQLALQRLPQAPRRVSNLGAGSLRPACDRSYDVSPGRSAWRHAVAGEWWPGR